MASGIATCVIAGNITRDGELNESGRVLAFGVAVNRREKERGSEEWGEAVHYFDCKVLGNRAEPLSKILVKGMKVTVQGDLVHERWENKEGEKRAAVRILAREVVLGDSRDKSESAPEPKSDDDPGW